MTAVLPTEMLTTEFGDVRVTQRAGVGSPLVFVHGYPDNLQIWARVFAEPALGGRRLIAFDWPGLGHSSTYVGGATPFHLGRHFIAVLDALGVDRVTPVGFDMGGHAVVAAASKHPERFEQMVLTNFLADGDVPTSWEIDVMRKLGLNRAILRYGPRVVFQRALRTFLSDATLSPEVRSDLWDGFSSKDALTYLRRMCAGYQAALPRVARLYPTIEVETLVIWGDDDPHFPLVQGEAVHAALPNSTMTVMNDAPHWFMWERPAETAKLLAEAVDR